MEEGSTVAVTSLSLVLSGTSLRAGGACRSHYGAQGAVEPAQARVCASDPVHGPGRSLSSVFVEGSEYGRLDRRRFPRERVQRTITR